MCDSTMRRHGAPSVLATAVALLFCATAVAQHEHHVPAAEPAPEHADHAGQASQDEHAGHEGHKASPAAETPVVTEAERAAAFPDLGDMNIAQMMESDPFNHLLLFDRLEAQNADGGEVLNWDFEGWVGRSAHRLWIKTEGHRESGTTERAELQLLWGKPIARWWDVVAGAREDFRPGPSQGWAAFGIQGLAPYRFELEATAFVGDGGRAAARLQAEYELLITNRLILQPLVELNWYSQSDAARGIGSGLSSAESGLRLRYEFRREIAPYIGLTRERTFGGTADLARAAGIDTRETRLVGGVRVWF